MYLRRRCSLRRTEWALRSVHADRSANTHVHPNCDTYKYAGAKRLLSVRPAGVCLRAGNRWRLWRVPGGFRGRVRRAERAVRCLHADQLADEHPDVQARGSQRHMTAGRK